MIQVKGLFKYYVIIFIPTLEPLPQHHPKSYLASPLYMITKYLNININGITASEIVKSSLASLCTFKGSWFIVSPS